MVNNTKINYNNGKIYKIEPLNGDEGDIYIGSTTKQYLSQRMDKHRADYKQFNEGKMKSILTSFKLFKKYGVENCNIVLMELVNASNKDELHAREAHFIKTLQCVNKNIPLQTDKEYQEANKDKLQQYKKIYNKEYSEANKDKIKNKDKNYRELNKEKIKEYRENNKDKMKEYNKKYSQDNKDKINAYRRIKRQAKKDELKNKESSI